MHIPNPIWNATNVKLFNFRLPKFQKKIRLLMGLSQVENIEMSTYTTVKQSDVKSHLAAPSQTLSKRFGSKKSKSHKNSNKVRHYSRTSSNSVLSVPV